MWNKLDKQSIPTLAIIEEYVRNPLWNQLCTYLDEQYGAIVKMEYSGCSIPGWNVKFKKAGRALCTLYPMEGYFICLIVIGEREKMEFKNNLDCFTHYLQDLYHSTEEGMGQRWLMIEAEDQDILVDIKKCIEIRRGIKNIGISNTRR